MEESKTQLTFPQTEQSLAEPESTPFGSSLPDLQRLSFEPVSTSSRLKRCGADTLNAFLATTTSSMNTTVAAHSPHRKAGSK